SWNGNLGSQAQNKIFFDRKSFSGSMFSDAYSPYLITPSNVKYYDTKQPYAELAWHSSVPKYHEEDYLHALFTMNANKHLNIGGIANLIYGRGQYANQTARAFNGGFFASYSGKQYAFNAMIMFNSHKNYENGGVSDSTYILHPEEIGGSYRSYNIPTLFNGNVYSKYRNNIFFLNHKYSLGIYRDRKLENDSVAKDFVPVTSFVHTFRYDGIRRQFKEKTITGNVYENTFYTPNSTNDSTRYGSLRNTFAVVLEEQFMKKVGFGLSAFIEHELNLYDVLSDTLQFIHDRENHLRIGATISRHEGKWVKFDITGKINLLGPNAGEFLLGGVINTDFKIKNDTMTLDAQASFCRTAPDYFYKHYNSNHFQWENNLTPYMEFRAGGRVALPKRNISVGATFSNLTNPIFINEGALPEQYAGNVQILAVDATINLRLWKFHLDNRAALQTTSDEAVVPLPLVALYSNFYFADKFFKVLTTQIGVSCRYHTAYHAPGYVAATGLFYNQRNEKIGNYPEMNAYINFHLKRVRFFALVCNWNQKLFGGRKYFSMPNYPLNPTTFHFGLSWTFYD
ncbi:MAG: putative porin, partial [Bacteroidales bacterium]|nr:putative porin [Bacteroidales bacterium]